MNKKTKTKKRREEREKNCFHEWELAWVEKWGKRWKKKNLDNVKE